MAKKRKYYFMKQDVSDVFSGLEYLTKDEKDSISFDNLLRYIEQSAGKKNFEQTFVRLVNENMSKILSAQLKAIKDGRSKDSLAATATKFLQAMEKIEDICVDKKVIAKKFLRDSLDEKAIKKMMLSAIKKSLQPSKTPDAKSEEESIANERYKKELKEIISFKITNNTQQRGLNVYKEMLQGIVLLIAEKKFGKLCEKNRDAIEQYVVEFDINKEDYKKDIKELSDFDVSKVDVQAWYMPDPLYSPFGLNMFYYPSYAITPWRYPNFMDKGFLDFFGGMSNETSYKWYQRACFYAVTSIEKPNNFDDMAIANDGSPLGAMLREFREKYGFTLNFDLLTDIVIDTKQFGEGSEVYYRKNYMDTFMRVFDHVDNGYKRITGIMNDFECIMQQVIKENAPDLARPEYSYGGLNAQELGSFLHSILEQDCNLTKKDRLELDTMKKDNKLSVKDAVSFSREMISNEISATDNKQERLINSIARLSALQQIHAERPTSFKIFSFWQYHKESQGIKELKNEITRFSGEAQLNMQDGKDVYKADYNEAKASVDGFVKQMTSAPVMGLEERTKVIEPNLTLSKKAIEREKGPVDIKAPEIQDLSKKKND